MTESQCATCPHPEHTGVCRYPITETVRDDVGIFAPASGLERTDIVGTCYCGERHHAMFVGGEIVDCLCGVTTDGDEEYEEHLREVWNEVKEDRFGSWINP